MFTLYYYFIALIYPNACFLSHVDYYTVNIVAVLPYSFHYWALLLQYT
jgi:hypothetical protein